MERKYECQGDYPELIPHGRTMAEIYLDTNASSEWHPMTRDEKLFYDMLELDYKSAVKQPIVKVKTYLMFDRTFNLHKIGSSVKPRSREATLAGQIPTIKLLAMHEDNIEKSLHIKFKEKRIRGEWFRLDNDDLMYIMGTGFHFVE